jgi:hypothetical protein
MPLLVYVYGGSNPYASLTALGSLTHLYYVDIDTTAVADLTPLAQNTAYSNGYVDTYMDTALSCTAQAANIAALKARSDNVSSCQ